MNLKAQTVGDRVLLFFVASVIGSVSGALLAGLSREPCKVPGAIGGFLLFEILFSVTFLCALSVIWAVFRPGRMFSLLSKTALKVNLVVFVVALGTAAWLRLKFVV